MSDHQKVVILKSLYVREKEEEITKYCNDLGKRPLELTYLEAEELISKLNLAY